MFATFDLCVGVLLGTFLGSLATLVYHVRQIRQETRQNYVRLSLAQAEVATLERTLEIHRRNSVTDFPRPIQNLAVVESEPSNALPLIPPWISNCESPIADGTTSKQPMGQSGAA